MSVESFQEFPVEQFGSLVTSLDPADIPVGLSPANQDVAYYPGGVRTRPGTTAAYEAIGAASSAHVVGMAHYVTLAFSQRLLILDSEGNLLRDDGPTRATLRSGLPAGTRMRSLPLFGSEFIGLSDGRDPRERPLMYDDQNLDRVSMCGPGDPPTVEHPSGADIAITGLARVSQLVTVTLATFTIDSVERTANTASAHTTAPHGLVVGDKFNTGLLANASFVINGATVTAVPDPQTVSWASAGADVVPTVMAGGLLVNLVIDQSLTIAGVADASFNGIFNVLATPAFNQFTFTYNDVDAAPGAGGTVTPYAQGAIEPGIRQVVYWWITRTGYWTKFSPPQSFTARGGAKMRVRLPIGPANVIGRGIAITLANGARFYHLADRMLLNDNSTTELIIDFQDSTLGAGLLVDELRDLEVLNAATNPIAYDNRVLWIGEENGLPGFNNFGFEGGARASGSPAGWIEGADFLGGSVEPLLDDFGCAYRITGDGVTVTRGQISQVISRDAWLGVSTLQPGRAYTVRFRVRRSAGLAAGTLVVRIFAPGVDHPCAVTAAGCYETWREISIDLLPALDGIPQELTLELSAIDTPTLDEYFELDELRILPTNELTRSSVARVSLSEDAESYKGTDGFLQVSENDGQALRTGFVIRSFCYLVKDRSLFVTANDGTSEPAHWSVEAVSSVIGTPSMNGVAVGDGWAIIASEVGPHFFNGGPPVNIGAEIQHQDPSRGLWGRINWATAGHRVWVRVNVEKKRVLFGVPLDGAAECTHILYLDYSDSAGSTGALLVDPVENQGRGRKWSLWNLAAHCMEIIEPGNHELLGNANGSGKIYELDSAAHSDDGAAIDDYYDTAYIGGSGFGDRLFGYLVAAVEGAGSLLLRVTRPGGDRFRDLPARNLSSPNRHDLELPTNVLDNRLSYRFRTRQVNHWFSLAKLRVYTKQNPWAGGGR